MANNNLSNNNSNLSNNNNSSNKNSNSNYSNNMSLANNITPVRTLNDQGLIIESYGPSYVLNLKEYPITLRPPYGANLYHRL